MFTDISIGKILNPIGLALSYQAAGGCVVKLGYYRARL
jgi:hypothetical protein